MTTHTERTQAWIDSQLATSVTERWRTGYERLYQSADRLGRMPVGHIISLARIYSILTALATVEFRSCLDVGCGSGRLAHLVRSLYDARAVGIDLSRDFAATARREFRLPAYVANAAVVPFSDGQFDLVLCSEVLEHVEYPFAVLAELWRVARVAVVLTTQEACRGAWHRRWHMAAVEYAQPHAERNYFIPDDFRRAFGSDVEITALLRMPERIRLLRPESVAELKDCMRVLAADRRLGLGSFGVLVVARKGPSQATSRVSPDAVLDLVVADDSRLDALAAQRAADPLSHLSVPMDVPVLTPPVPVCPECYGALDVAEEATVRCLACAATFPVHQGAAVLLGSQAAIARSEAAWGGRASLDPVRRALAQRPFPTRWGRKLVRATIKVSDFLLLPMPWAEKISLGWRYLRWG